MGQVISFINMKGGVGKTTLAVNIAYGLANLHDKRVLIVDGDPQFNASTYLMTEDDYLTHIEDPRRRTLFDVFMPRKPGTISSVRGATRGPSKPKLTLASCSVNIWEGPLGRLDLIPSTLTLMEIETSKRGTENRLKHFLDTTAQGYDYVIIDCPPTISIFTQAAILASGKYLVPVKPDPLSTIGLPLLERWLEDFTDDAGMTITPVGIVFCLVRGVLPKRMATVMDDLRNEREDEVFSTMLTEKTIVAESVEKHQPVFMYKPNSASAEEITDITTEFLERTTGE